MAYDGERQLDIVCVSAAVSLPYPKTNEKNEQKLSGI